MCQSCNALAINGINCHEIGCPDAKADYAKRAGCQWCGRNIAQDSETAVITDAGAFCDDDCAKEFNG